MKKSVKNLPQEHLVDDDVARAADELPVPDDPETPRPPGAVSETVGWGEAPSDSGHSAEQLQPEDESSAAEQLIRGGAEAAEEDRRKAAEIGKQDRTRL